jgi:hypothetical protein
MRRGRGSAGEAVAVVALALAVAIAALWVPATEAQRGARVGQPAPEITGSPWLNSEPLSLAGLRGRVVFVEFWTYG